GFTFPEGIHHIGGFVGDTLASVLNWHEANGIRIHFQVLKPYRRYARELLNLSLAPLAGHGSVHCVIPTLYRSVINFARHSGFEAVAIIPGAHQKNGRLYDSLLMERIWE